MVASEMLALFEVDLQLSFLCGMDFKEVQNSKILEVL